MDAEDKGYFADLSYNMRRLVEQVGFPQFPNLDDDEAEIYERMQHGRCMTCVKPLGKHTSIIIARVGIVAMYCSGVCHSDMAVMGWLQEQMGDLQEKVSLRNLQMPQADETPDDSEPESP